MTKLKKYAILISVLVLPAMLLTLYGCSTSLQTVPTLRDEGSETPTGKNLSQAAETPAATKAETTDQFGNFTGSFHVYPPFRIAYDKSLWEYRSPDDQKGKPP